MKRIEITHGQFALVDDEDFEELCQYKWYIRKNAYTFYAYRPGRVGNSPTTIYMHRQIMKSQKGLETDHIDGNGLNNQKANLRICTKTDNRRNRGMGRNNTSGYKGVDLNKKTGKYRASIQVDGKSLHLGLFDTPILAAKRYDEAAKLYHGEFARLNFPEQL